MAREPEDGQVGIREMVRGLFCGMSVAGSVWHQHLC